MLASPATTSSEYPYNTSKPRLEKYMISDQQANANIKKSSTSTYKANNRTQLSILFVHSLVVLSHGMFVWSKINVCIHTAKNEKQAHHNPCKVPFRVHWSLAWLGFCFCGDESCKLQCNFLTTRFALQDP